MLNLFRQSFKKANIVESKCTFANPYRGMYQIFTVSLGEETDFDRFSNCLVPTESLILLIVDIGIYKDKLLDEKAITQIEQSICFFSACKKKIIFRPVYDHEGKGEEREPNSFELIKSHLMTIADITSRNADSIFVLQGLLVGNWGEMHGSKYLGKGHLKEMIDILDERLAGKVYLSVRKPSYYRKIRNGYEFSEDKCKIGLFDDAILASETDFGTYGVSEATEWEKSWTRESELTFEETVCLEVPNGGETVLGEGYTEKISAKEVIRTLAKMRLTYLNRLYDRRVLDRWNSVLCGVSGVWKSSTLYEYIENHLGYRYVIESLNDGLKGNTLSLELCVANNGFAPSYNEINLKLIAVCDGKQQIYFTDQKVNQIEPNTKEKMNINVRLRNSLGTVNRIYIAMSYAEIDERVLFGNVSQDGCVYLGELMDYMIEGVEN